jgi:hypothetical protein
VTPAVDGVVVFAVPHPLSVARASETPRSSTAGRRRVRMGPAPDEVIGGLRSS